MYINRNIYIYVYIYTYIHTQCIDIFLYLWYIYIEAHPFQSGCLPNRNWVSKFELEERNEAAFFE